MLYRDRDWLENQYVDLGKSMNQIAAEVGTNSSVICRWMSKLGIGSRSAGDSIRLAKKRTCRPDESFLSLIDGLMVSDGCVSIDKFGRCYYVHGCKHRSYVESISSDLGRCGVNCVGPHRMSTGMWHIQSGRTFDFFRDQRARWYPNGKKVIPSDFRFDATSLLHWYLGDGDLSCRHNRRYIRLATACFTPEENAFLCDGLRSLGLSCEWRWEGDYPRISLFSYATDKFFKLVGDCPIKEFKYKWKKNLGHRS